MKYYKFYKTITRNRNTQLVSIKLSYCFNRATELTSSSATGCGRVHAGIF